MYLINVTKSYVTIYDHVFVQNNCPTIDLSHLLPTCDLGNVPMRTSKGYFLRYCYVICP